jgi:sugar O-acyltransferase (sialic acid O-acetyltransferase NeuD family)
VSALPVIVVGAGGHALVIADALLAAGATVLGFTDPRLTIAGTRHLGLSVLGGDEALLAYRPAEVRLANGIGGVRPNPLRRDVQRQLEIAGWTFVGVRHPSAVVSPFAQVAATAQLLPRCVVQPNAKVDEGTIINTGAIVEHGVEIGAFAHIAPGAVVCGDAVIGLGSHVGAGSVVRQGARLGPRTLVAAGAAVIADFAGDGMLAGVPATARYSQ